MRREFEGTRVAIVGDWPPPLGGVSVHVRSLAEAARKAGARVTVLDIGKGQHDEADVIPSGREVRFAATLAALASTHDVLHLHTSGANTKSWVLLAAVALAAKGGRAKAVATLHSGHGPRWLSTPTRAVVARTVLAGYDQVVCVSEEISRALSRIGAGTGRHLVAPAFGKEGLAAATPPASVKKLRDGHRVMVSAMLAPGRDYGAQELFASMALLRRSYKDAALVVFGPGTEDEKTAELADESGVPCLRLGQVDRAQALGIMRDSDLFVRPTRVDGDSVSVREALAMGVRVVATRAGHRPQGVHLCEPGDAVDLARVLGEALEAPAARVVLPSHDGIEKVLELYGKLSARPQRRAA